MGRYLGDFRRSQNVRFQWNSFNSSGASVTRSTNGTISVYKDGGTTQTTTGVTDTEDFDSLTGVHDVLIATTDAFYVPGSDYSVVLSAATIDGQTVNAVLAHFSIENRFQGEIRKSTAQAGGNTSITLDASASATDDYYVGGMVFLESGTGALQARIITDYVGSTKVCTVDRAWATNPDNTSVFRVFPGSLGSTSAEDAAAVFSRTFDGTKMSGLTFEQIIGLMASVLLGKASGLDTTTAVFRNIGDSANAISATVDADGNRSAVSLTAASVA